MLSFSIYRYRQQTTIDERKTFCRSAAAVGSSWLSSQLNELPPGWDLAINSLVRDSSGAMWHLPMIDFAKPNLTQEDWSLMQSVLGKPASELAIFRSGRDLHGYGTTLIELERWPKYMGALLLLNLPEMPALVDARWVGHRLIAGYSALRWSSNSPHYLGIPTIGEKEIG